MTAISGRAEGVLVSVRLKPRARVDCIDGERAGALEVRVTAPAIGGRANQALLRLLAKRLRRAPSSLELVRGQRGRDKQILIPGAKAVEVRRELGGNG